MYDVNTMCPFAIAACIVDVGRLMKISALLWVWARKSICHVTFTLHQIITIPPAESTLLVSDVAKNC